MKRILLAVLLLGTGSGVFLAAHQSTRQAQRTANASREAWLAQTQLVTLTRSQCTELATRVQAGKRELAGSSPTGGNPLWAELEKTHARHLAPELRERLLEELGFNWRASEEFVVVSKETLREISLQAVRRGKLTDATATILAMTPEERGQVEAAIQRSQTEFKDWASSHTERSEPQGDIVAQYTLPAHPELSQSLSNSFATQMLAALGRERADLLTDYARDWLTDLGVHGEPTVMTVKRQGKSEYQVQLRSGAGSTSQNVSPYFFPAAFRPLFPNGWPDVAKREGFELPSEFKK